MTEIGEETLLQVLEARVQKLEAVMTEMATWLEEVVTSGQRAKQRLGLHD